jgi:hypothetical protein
MGQRDKTYTEEQKRGAKVAAAWTHPPGTRVLVQPDVGPEAESRTLGMAWVLADGTPVVSVAGHRGGYALERVRLAPPAGAPGAG